MVYKRIAIRISIKRRNMKVKSKCPRIPVVADTVVAATNDALTKVISADAGDHHYFGSDKSYLMYRVKKLRDAPPPPPPPPSSVQPMIDDVEREGKEQKKGKKRSNRKKTMLIINKQSSNNNIQEDNDRTRRPTTTATATATATVTATTTASDVILPSRHDICARLKFVGREKIPFEEENNFHQKGLEWFVTHPQL